MFGTAKNKAASTYPQPASSPQGKARGPVSAEIMGPRLALLLCTLALLLIGFVMVYSASSIAAIDEGVSHASYLVKQLGFAVVGIAACLVVWKLVPYYAWMGPLVWIVWGTTVFLLILTAAIGTVGLGAQRWVNIGPVSLQPAEFAKIAFILMAARILFDFRNGTLGPRAVFVHVFVLIVLPLGLLYLTQSDLGTTLICAAGILMVMWLGEVPLKVVVATLVAGLVLALIASTVGYRQDRFIFFNPWSDHYGAGYQLIHSFYAFSEGGLFGVGLGNSREKYLYLPEAETDFIFAIIGEELGLIGALGVIALFLVFLVAGMRIARTAPDNLGTMIAGSFTAMVVFQAFLNIGCVIGVLPTTGKPLPFISSGGSSLIASMIMLGLILSVSQASSAPSIYEQRRADLRVVRAEPPHPPGQRKAAQSRSQSPAGASGRADGRTRSKRPSSGNGPRDRR